MLRILMGKKKNLVDATVKRSKNEKLERVLLMV
jgi:hypothetical protein